MDIDGNGSSSGKLKIIGLKNVPESTTGLSPPDSGLIDLIELILSLKIASG